MEKTQTPVKQTKQGRRNERRLENQRKEQARKRAARNRRIAIITGIAVVAVIAISFAVFAFLNKNTNNQANNSSAPTVDTSSSLAPVVDNIACESQEQGSYHIHAHISLFINGQRQAITPNIGINQQQGCLYWIHTHDNSGVIHIEAPQQITYKLGNFFHIWGQQFPQLQYPTQLNVQSGWQVYLNGSPYTGNFNDIPLDAHALITMAYNSPNIQPDTTYNWQDL